MIWNEPRSAGGLIRDAVLGIWSARGGGFYGLGYLITFVSLEARTAVGEFVSSDTLMSFVGQELLGYLLRFGLMSFVNAAVAFLWPLIVLDWLGGWGLLVLAAGYVAFERWLRPLVESTFPEIERSRRERRRKAGRDGPVEAGTPAAQRVPAPPPDQQQVQD